MALFTPPIDLSVWSPDGRDLTKWVYDIWKYLETFDISDKDIQNAVDKYLTEHGYADVTQDVTKLKEDVAQITSEITALRQAAYTADNPPPYPVTSVNGQTGDVVIQSGGGTVKTVNSITPDQAGNIKLTASDIMLTATDNTSVLSSLNNKADETEFREYATATAANTNAIGTINDILPTKYSATNIPPYPLNYSEYSSKQGFNIFTNDNRYMLSSNENTLTFSLDSTEKYNCYTTANQPPYPVKTVNYNTGNVITDHYISYTNLTSFYVTAFSRVNFLYNISIDGILAYGNTITLTIINTSGAYAKGCYGSSYNMGLNNISFNINQSNIVMYFKNEQPGEGINYISVFISIFFTNEATITKPNESSAMINGYNYIDGKNTVTSARISEFSGNNSSSSAEGEQMGSNITDGQVVSDQTGMGEQGVLQDNTGDGGTADTQPVRPSAD